MTIRSISSAVMGRAVQHPRVLVFSGVPVAHSFMSIPLFVFRPTLIYYHADTRTNSPPSSLPVRTPTPTLNYPQSASGLRRILLSPRNRGETGDVLVAGVRVSDARAAAVGALVMPPKLDLSPGALARGHWYWDRRLDRAVLTRVGAPQLFRSPRTAGANSVSLLIRDASSVRLAGRGGSGGRGGGARETLLFRDTVFTFTKDAVRVDRHGSGSVGK